MKKTAIALFFMLTGLSLFAQTGIIRELSGTVELRPSGASSFAAAKAGDQVSQDTVISTGFRSTALIGIGSAIITVRPLTRLTLTEIQASSGSESLNVNLQAGRVRVDVNPPAGTRTSMAVTSPVATASVRGTSFEFDTRNLRVNQGTVNFRGNRGGLMRVNAGFNSRVGSDGKAADPVDARARGLRPQPPAGAGSFGGSSGGGSGGAAGGNGGVTPEPPGATDGTITIQIEY